jgi:hypothetical protein
MYRRYPEFFYRRHLSRKGTGYFKIMDQTMDTDSQTSTVIRDYQKLIRLNRLHLTAHYNFPNIRRLEEVNT